MVKRTPNPEQAENLIQKAVKRLEYAKQREITEENADLVLEDAYEAAREAIDAFLVNAGFKSYSHEASIIYGLEELRISKSETNRLDQFRKLRNDSKYRGEDVSKEQSEKCLKLVKNLIPELKKKFQEK